MSRSHKQRRKPVVERAYTPNYANAMGIQGGSPSYGAGQSVTVPLNILNAMLQNMAPQKGQAKDFAPGSPLRPYPGVVPQMGPRAWPYPTGSNISGVDRSLMGQYPDIPSFQQLRNLAQLYEGVAICERVVLDLIPKLMPKVSLTKAATAGGAEEKDFQPQIAQWMKFVEMPDPAQKMDIHTWLRMAWIEQTQLDALAIYKQMTRGKQLYGLQIISGDTMKPLIDERGMIPQPPYPAYQQYPYGIPGDEYTTDQMIYYRESPRAFTPYGYSRVERIIMRVNQALRKEQKDLARWTEGNIPASIIEVPADMNWTPDEIDAFEQQWNSLLAGNYQQQVRAKFLQAGMKYNPIDDVELNTPFDQFLLNISAAAYGLSMQDLAFTEDIHKSSGDSQQNVLYRRTLYPLVSVYARMFTNLQRENTGVDVLEYDFGGFDEVEDVQSLATAYTTLTNAGVLGLSDAAKIMQLPMPTDAPYIGRVIITKSGPIFLDDMASDKMRDAAMQAQLAGFQLAANPPQQDDEEGDQSESQSQPPPQGKTGNGANNSADHSGGSSKTATGQAKKGTTSTDKESSKPAERATDTAYIWQQGSCTCAECTSNHGSVRRTGETYPSGATDVGSHDGCDCQRVPYTPEPQDTAVARLLTQVEELLARLSSNDKQRPKMLEEHTGMMLAFLLDPKTAEKLAIPGGEPADNLHVTLAFLGDKQDEVTDDKLRPHTSPFKIRDAISIVTSEAKPLTGKIAGIGRFTTQEEGKPTPVYASVDVPGLVELRTQLVEAIQAAGYFVDDTHGYTAHITLAYVDADAPMPIDEVPQLPLTLDTVTLCVGEDDRAFRLGDEQYSAYWEAQPPQKRVVSEQDVREEYRRWRARAIDDIKAGRPLRSFTTAIIPEHIHTHIATELEDCTTLTEVKEVFNRVRDAEKRAVSGKDELAKSIQALFEDVESRGSKTLTV